MKLSEKMRLMMIIKVVMLEGSFLEKPQVEEGEN